MRPARLRPLRQIFVCTNRRGDDDPLRSGCGDAGPAVFTALKSAALRAASPRDVWVTATRCLGHCPPRGCAVAMHPQNVHLVEVEAGDVDAVLHAALAPSQDAPR